MPAKFKVGDRVTFHPNEDCVGFWGEYDHIVHEAMLDVRQTPRRVISVHADEDAWGIPYYYYTLESFNWVVCESSLVAGKTNDVTLELDG